MWFPLVQPSVIRSFWLSDQFANISEAALLHIENKHHQRLINIKNDTLGGPDPAMIHKRATAIAKRSAARISTLNHSPQRTPNMFPNLFPQRSQSASVSLSVTASSTRGAIHSNQFHRIHHDLPTPVQVSVRPRQRLQQRDRRETSVNISTSIDDVNTSQSTDIPNFSFGDLDSSHISGAPSRSAAASLPSYEHRSPQNTSFEGMDLDLSSMDIDIPQSVAASSVGLSVPPRTQSRRPIVTIRNTLPESSSFLAMQYTPQNIDRGAVRRTLDWSNQNPFERSESIGLTNVSNEATVAVSTDGTNSELSGDINRYASRSQSINLDVSQSTSAEFVIPQPRQTTLSVRRRRRPPPQQPRQPQPQPQQTRQRLVSRYSRGETTAAAQSRRENPESATETAVVRGGAARRVVRGRRRQYRIEIAPQNNNIRRSVESVSSTESMRLTTPVPFYLDSPAPQ